MTRGWRRTPGEAGFTLIELMVAATVAGVLAAGALSLLHATGRLLAAHTEALQGVESARVVRTILPSELRLATPTEIVGRGADSVVVRAIRGTAIICAGTPGAPLVRFRGLRQPNPAKDSLIVVAPAGGAERVTGLASDAAGDGPCSPLPGESIRRWAVADSVGRPGDILLLFEHGTYSFSGAALRYRRGAGGRQPLTDETIPEGSFLWQTGSGAVRVQFKTAFVRAQPKHWHPVAVRLRNWPHLP